VGGGGLGRHLGRGGKAGQPFQGGSKIAHAKRNLTLYRVGSKKEIRHEAKPFYTGQ